MRVPLKHMTRDIFFKKVRNYAFFELEKLSKMWYIWCNGHTK